MKATRKSKHATGYLGRITSIALSLLLIMPSGAVAAYANPSTNSNTRENNASWYLQESLDSAKTEHNPLADSVENAPEPSPQPETAEWEQCGTCEWRVDNQGCLVIRPAEDASTGTLDRWSFGFLTPPPWHYLHASITSAKIEGTVVAKNTSTFFMDCRSLETVDLSGLDTSNVTNMSCMFWGCDSLKTVDLTKLDTTSVADMSHMFSGCSSLESLDLSTFNTSSVTDMSHMFWGCDALEFLNLSSFNTTSVTSMDYMFEDCSSLRQIILGERFSFNGNSTSRLCELPTPTGLGKWVSSSDGKAYAPFDIPSNTTATYTAQLYSNHQMSNWRVTTTPTCTTNGKQMRSCTYCGFTEIQSIPASDHEYDGWTILNKATCTTVGLEQGSCKHCSAVTIRDIPVAKHELGKWQTIKPAEPGIDGTEIGECSNCGHLETRKIPALPLGEWKEDSVGWQWLRIDGTSPVSCWEQIEGEWYHFNERGYREVGWVYTNGAWRYLALNGVMQTGWISDDGSWYYLNPNNDGIMCTGWVHDDSKWYYLRDSGKMATGWVYSGSHWYHMNGSGIMQTGWIYEDGSWYYLHASGKMAIGWIQVDGYWYFLDNSGRMLYSCWIGDYYLLANGVMATSQWIGNHYVGPDGKYQYTKSYTYYVYIAASGNGTKYHRSPSCSNMKGAIKTTASTARSWGYTACAKCY